MRTHSFKTEIRRVCQNINHALHDRVHSERGHMSGWRRIDPKPRSRSHLTIFDVMQTHPVTVRPETRLDWALHLMVEHEISGLPVIDEEGRIVGILSECDVLKIFYEPDVANVASVMSSAPDAVSVHTPLVDVLDRLMATDLARVLIHENGRLVGVVTRARLMPKILESLRQDARARMAGLNYSADASNSH